MTKALLFDLDGTLLPVDTDYFVKQYLKALAAHVSKHMDPERFTQSLWQATQAMMANVDPERTNEEVFEEEFIKLTRVDKESFWPLFDDFYERVFPTLHHFSEPTPLAKDIVDEAVHKGYKMAVATNPVFPKTAIEHRIKWAGIDHVPFEVVTAYENSRFTKPHVQYYQMICDQLEVKPEECIMIGNDIQEDMSASKIGMRTFLVEDYIVDRNSKGQAPKYQIDDRGKLTELYIKLKNSQGIFS